MDSNSLDSVATAIGLVQPVRFLGKGKSGYSYLSTIGTRQVVLKQMHDEPCPYYSFGDNKVRLEVCAYRRLSEAGLQLPRQLTFDENRGYLVKDYVPGITAECWNSTTLELDHAVEQLFGLARQLKSHGLNIDYFPANFVINEDGVHYIDYEVNPFDPRWSFENWGIYYWANGSGIRKYAKTRDWRHINDSEISGLPIKEPFEQQVADQCCELKPSHPLYASLG